MKDSKAVLLRPFYSFILFLLIYSSATGQNAYLDSLQRNLANAKNEDTTRVLALSGIADFYGFNQFDSCFYYASLITDLSQKLNYTYGKYLGYRSTFYALNTQGNYPKALEAAQNLLKTAELTKDKYPWRVAGGHYFIGVLNREMADYPKAIDQFHVGIKMHEESGETKDEFFYAFSQLGILYATLNKLDSALWYAKMGFDLGRTSRIYQKYYSLAISALGGVNMRMHHFQEAGDLFRYGIIHSTHFNNTYFEARNYNSLGGLCRELGQKDSAIYYARIGLNISSSHNFQEFVYDASRILSQVYESEDNPDSTLKYMKIMLTAKDSVFSQSKGQQFQRFAYDEIQRLQQVSAEREKYMTSLKIYALLIALVIFLFLAFILYRNSRHKQRDKVKIEKAYEELKSTQSQLIQAEKMASLGELTAGIAHEIQNPLNFVNNFSEVNTELLQEMKEAMDKGSFDNAKSIANEIIGNEEKINHHGKRADSIVKSMLLHSRTSSGQMERTDINSLTDEYLRLSYHGFRAKEKSFNVTLKTDFDNAVGSVNVISQDIGRVLLNLLNNAFYAATQAPLTPPIHTEGEAPLPPKGGFSEPNYKHEPTVWVSTKRKGDRVLISVKDNGPGIPAKIVDKIFQPFFTTKPTGQGTGLGLSLSYDIIKAHGGELKVETKEGEGAVFIIQLPLV